MQNAKVAFLTIAFQRGGVERVISTLSHHLPTQNILILYEDKNRGYPFKSEVFSLDGNSPAHGKIIRFLKRFFRLHQLLGSQNINCVVSFMPRPNLLALLMKWSRIYRGRLLINEVNVVSKQPISSMMKWCITRLYPIADRVVVPSQDIRDDLVACYSIPVGKVAVIPNPFDVAEIILQSNQPITLPWPDKEVRIIVAAGRLTPQKGFDLLIEAFASVRLKMNVRLVILGDGECERSLRQLAEERGVLSDIHFAGWQGNPYAYFRQADLFVLSSRYEGFGNVIVEAMSCGLPVVSTDCPGGPAEILGKGKFGILVPVNNSGALADAMLRIFRDDDFRQGLVGKSLVRCRDFDVATIVQRWQDEVTECSV